MSHEINIPDSTILRTRGETYDLIIKQVDFLLQDEDNVIANLSNITSVLKYSLKDVIWAGVYFFEPHTNQLVLGPFQGKVACTRIKLGEGVCGQALLNKETLIVPDVEKFPGHIYCDSASRSEIVVPVFLNGEPKGVLDLDSDKLNNFDLTDKEYLEKLISKINYLFNNE